ncbi:flavodoxin domain-containing protein [Halobiforma nitratireducens]|nr:flavodoxin domain-containing protein [Halobiforma nitratireducens]
MTRVLVAYGSSEGQTAAVAERIGEILETEGCDATLVHLQHPPSPLEPAVYDGVVVGASVHAGSHQRYVESFVRSHRETLNRRPTAFVSVSLSAASDDAERRGTADELLDGFLEKTDWDPDGTLSVAGALKYSEYGLFTRLLMRRLGGKERGDTDTSRDYEYTDWEAVESFTREFATLVDGD